MRPHKLILQAFGSFKNKAVIDFDKLGGSLYLIAGETGTGKTTIFDGICVALFGAASGSDRSNNTADKLYSNYCRNMKAKPEMQIELTFSHNNKMYTVERTGKWGSKGTASTIKFNSKLSCKEWQEDISSDKEMASSKKNSVTAKIEEILSLNLAQFRQVIMLSQGEFSRFIKANTKEKNEILGRICSNRQYKDFENRLHAVRLLLAGKEDELSKNVNNQLENFELPENDEEKQQYSYKNAQLLSLLEQQLRDNEDKLKKTNDELGEINYNIIEWNNKRTKAEADNKKLLMLKECENKKKELEQKKADIEQLGVEIILRENLLKVYIHEENYNTAQEKQENIRIEIEQKKTAIEQIKKAVACAIENEQKQQEFIPKIDQLKNELQNITSVLPVYDICEKAKSETAQMENDYNNLAGMHSSVEGDINQKENELAELNKKDDSLKDAGDSQVALCSDKYQQIVIKQNELKAYSDEYSMICSSEEKLKKIKEEYQLAEEEQENAEKQLKKDKNKLLSIDEKLEELKDAGDNSVKLCQNQFDEAERKQKDVKGLFNDLDAILGQEEEIERLIKAEKKAKEKSEKARLEYETLENDFYAGQAAILSDELVKAIKENGKGVCPVCGTVHDSKSLENIKKTESKVPKQEDVRSAKEKYSKADKAWQDSKSEYQEKISGCKKDINSFVKKAEGLLDTAYSWEELRTDDGQVIQQMCDTLSAELTEIKKILDKANDDKNAKEDLSKMKKNIEKSIEEMEINLKKAKDKVNQKFVAITENKTELNKSIEALLKKSMTVLGENIALEYMYSSVPKLIKTKEKLLQNEAKTANNILSKAKADRDSLKKTKADIETVNAEIEKLKIRLQDVVKEENSARDNLNKKKNELSGYRAKLDGYPINRDIANSKINNLQKEIAGLQKQIEDAENARKKLEGEQNDLAGQLKALEKSEKEQIALTAKLLQEFKVNMAKYDFADVAVYKQAYFIDGEQRNISYIEDYISNKKKEIQCYNNEVIANDTSLAQYKEETAGIHYVGLDAIDNELLQLHEQLESGNSLRDNLNISYNAKKQAHKKIEELVADYSRLREVKKHVDRLDDVIYNKNHMLSVYVLDVYFRQILNYANKHINMMSKGQFSFVPKNQISGLDDKLELDFKIQDMGTENTVDVESLSGGEKFEVSLSMALGLSDLAQMQGGGQINIDSMFIDEGFGSLGGKDLSRATDMLNSLAKNNRQIGIISHVEALEESIGHKINVTKSDEDGSMVKIE